jgi:para-nitrobenzyl esterase
MKTFIVLFAVLIAPAPCSASDPNPIAEVTGGKVRGALLSPRGAAFKGIPYARPPVNELRWREPAPVASWIGVREVTLEGSPCAQNPYFVHDAKETSKEDCLYLNVWTPSWPVRSARKPVMIWIHGGGNFGGAWNSRVPERKTPGPDLNGAISRS